MKLATRKIFSIILAVAFISIASAATAHNTEIAHTELNHSQHDSSDSCSICAFNHTSAATILPAVVIASLSLSFVNQIFKYTSFVVISSISSPNDARAPPSLY